MMLTIVIMVAAVTAVRLPLALMTATSAWHVVTIQTSLTRVHIGVTDVLGALMR